MAESNWDVEKLKQELKKHTEMRDNLLQTTDRMQKAVKESQIILKDIPNEDNIWRDRFTQQQTYNRQLEAQLAELERKLESLNAQQEVAKEKSSELTYDDMSDASMRQLLKRLEKEKTDMKWQLRDCEWKLDQEAAARHKAEEERKATLTQLGQVNHQT